MNSNDREGDKRKTKEATMQSSSRAEGPEQPDMMLTLLPYLLSLSFLVDAALGEAQRNHSKSRVSIYN